MKRFCLLGHNISYSLSPLIHKRIYEATGYEATYELVSMSTEELPVGIEKLKTFDGFNITKPHKQNILPYLSGEHPKSVNTVRVESGKLYGYSTDGYGFTRDLKIKFGEIGGRALVLGAGGVARVIVEELKNLGFDVCVYNRTPEKAESLAAEFGVKAVNREDVSPDLIVNCTSCGFKAGENPLLGDKGEIAADVTDVKWAYDTIYSPPETDFLKSLKNAKRANGFGMLILQAIQADRIMCGLDISDKLEKELYDGILKELQGE